MPTINYDSVKTQVPLRDVLHMLGFECQGYYGADVRGRCPLRAHTHSDKREFWFNGVHWFCHRCKKGGDVLDLWCIAKGVGVYTAAVSLCDLAGVPVPYVPRRPRRGSAAPSEQEEDR